MVCTLGVTIETLVPTSRLSRVDLPTLGAPRIATKPQRVGGWSVMALVRSRGAPAAARRAACSAARLEPPGAPAGAPSASATATSKVGACAGPEAPIDAIVGQAEAAALGPLLQGGLGVARRARASLEPRLPVGANERRGRRPGRHRDRGRRSAPRRRRRGSRVGRGRHRPPPRCARARASRRSRAPRATSASVSLAHQTGVALRQRALALVGKAGEQQSAIDQAEHPVAEELEPLVAAAGAPARTGGAAVGQRLAQQRLVGEAWPSRCSAAPRPARAAGRRLAAVTRSVGTAAGSGSRRASSRSPTAGRCRWSRRR